MQISTLVQSMARELVENPPTDPLVNLRTLLQQRLVAIDGVSELQASELTEIWLERFLQQIDSILYEWDAVGIPRPIITGGAPHVLLTYRSEQYAKHNAEKLPSDFGNMINEISTMTPNEFLWIPVCLLHIAGCDPIYITDAKDDGGVDCIGIMPTGTLRSLCVFLQAKTSTTKVSKQTLQLEHRKFEDLKGSGLLTTYTAALSRGNTKDGLSICYGLVTNNEFEKSAIKYAAERHILLRSSRQIAYWLSKHYGLDKIRNLIRSTDGKLQKSLQRNFANVLHQYWEH
jgi:hypothetical protein